MMLQYRVSPAISCPKKDLIAALDIYCKTVDDGSLTDTNQIKDYIWNAKSHKKEERKMFFYLLYNGNNEVCGFSEFAYLPHCKTLFLDYLCTSQRNHVLFYLFYHMVLNDITSELKEEACFIRYIITELSTNQVNGVLCDKDSNYFRHLLTNEGFQLSKYPYYQPPLLPSDEPREFNLAIKLIASDDSTILVLNRKLYLAIVHEIYYSHYLEWFNCFSASTANTNAIKDLFSRIIKEMPNNTDVESISLIKCQLFDEGQCPKYNVQSLTLEREKTDKRGKIITMSAWGFFTVLTFVLFLIDNNLASKISAFISIIAGAISIISFRKDFFRSKH